MDALVFVVFLLVGLAVFAGVLVLIIKSSGMRGKVDAARAEFLQRVGYPWASALGGDKARTRTKATAAGTFSHTFDQYTEGPKRFTVQFWHLAAQPAVHFQLIEKTLLGTTRMILNTVGPTSRSVTVSYPGPIPTGDPALDARFALFAPNAQAAVGIVRRPDIRDSLLRFSECVIRAGNDGVSFSDPTDGNVYRPGSGASRTDFSPEPTIRSSMQVHLDVENLLARLAAAR